MDAKLQNKVGQRWLSCYRNIHTTQELREAEGLRSEIGELVCDYGNTAFKLLPRGRRRGPKQLPTAWDDIHMSLFRNPAFSRAWIAKHFGR